jgi:peptidoglycan/LPS O-acetylase OafA/YrhL
MVFSRTGLKFLRPATIHDRLCQHGGVGPGFDLLRLGLALLIFNAHAGAILNPQSSGQIVIDALAQTTDANVPWINWREPIYLIMVPLFFALSGFLVTGSAVRTNTVPTFLIFRGLRIVPALAIEVTLSALCLGAFFTRLDLHSYFTNPELLRYFGNIAGFVYFYLPGVFEDSPVEGIVNNSLWTLPAEFYCYLFMAAFMLTGVLYDRRKFTLLFAVFTICAVVASFYIEHAFPKHGNFPLWAIVYCFFCGVLFFHWREHIIVSVALVAVAAIATYGSVYMRAPLVVCVPIVSYLSISIGMLAFPKIPLLARNDYSYGIYLYGFPITQAVRELLATGDYSHDKSLRLLALAATVVFAAASWHFLEKPALKQKRRFISQKSQLGAHL